MGGENGQFTRGKLTTIYRAPWLMPSALIDAAINSNDHSQNIILICAAGSGSESEQTSQPGWSTLTVRRSVARPARV